MNSRSHLVAHPVWNGNGVFRLGDHLFPAAIAADIGHHPLSKLEIRDVSADALDDAGDLRSRREGERRRHLVLVAEQERIEEIETDRRHSDEDVVRPRARLRRLLEAQRLRSAKFAELRNAHQPCSLLNCPVRNR